YSSGLPAQRRDKERVAPTTSGRHLPIEPQEVFATRTGEEERHGKTLERIWREGRGKNLSKEDRMTKSRAMRFSLVILVLAFTASAAQAQIGAIVSNWPVDLS